MTTTIASPSCRAAGALLGCLIVGLLFTVPAAAQDEPPERVDRYGDLVSIFSGDIRVPSHVNRRGMVFSLGGDVVIEGTVREVIVVGGSVRVTGGKVRGQVVGVLSRITLEDAVIGDQLVNVLGGLTNRGSYIDGQTVNISLGNWFPGLTALVFWGRLFFLLAAFVMLLLLGALAPDRIRIIGEETPTRYVTAFFVGILGYLGLLVLVGLLSATLIGIPLALFGFYVIKWLGVGGVFYAIGRRIGRGFGAEMSVLGAVLITFAIYALIRVAPTPLGLPGMFLSSILWTLFFLLIEIPAVGMIILTRMGTRAGGAASLVGPPMVPAGPAPAYPAAPPAGPMAQPPAAAHPPQARPTVPPPAGPPTAPEAPEAPERPGEEDPDRH